MHGFLDYKPVINYLLYKILRFPNANKKIPLKRNEKLKNK